MRRHIKIHNFLLFVLIVVPWNSGLTRNSTSQSIDTLVETVERLTQAQAHAGSIASGVARDKLAQISSHWAKVAQKLVYWKSNEVMELTQKAQDAQIISFKFSSIASRLKSAVTSAEEVFNSAFER